MIPKRPEKCEELLWANVITNCFKKDADDRPNAEQLYDDLDNYKKNKTTESSYELLEKGTDKEKEKNKNDKLAETVYIENPI